MALSRMSGKLLVIIVSPDAGLPTCDGHGSNAPQEKVGIIDTIRIILEQ
jgi:hypothetical protein